MAMMGLLFPNEEMVQMANEILKEQRMPVVYMKAIHTVDAVQEAREAIGAGADIIIARGYQAMLIKRYTNIPLVEMRLHTQEIGLLIKKAKAMIKSEKPRIGLVVFQNMISDISCMEELFDVKLIVACMDRMEDCPQKLEELSEAGIDVVIGGNVICAEAEKMGYPSLCYGSSAESLREALREAERMAFAMDVEKQNEAQFETVLDTSFNGIIKINAEGNITVINKLVENLLGKNLEEVVGASVMDVFPDFDQKAIRDVLDGKRDSYTISVNLRQQAWILMVAPIQYDERITGAILSLQKISENIRRSDLAKRDMFLNGFVAQTTFRDIHTESEAMKTQIELAKKYALSNLPVLIYSEEGTEYNQLGEAIHNNSIRKAGPFVSVEMGALEAEKQLELLFGNTQLDQESGAVKQSALVRANHGTILIKGIEHMSIPVQYKLMQVIMPESVSRNDIQPLQELNVRIVGVSKTNLLYLVERGMFSERLYYMLQGLTIELPSLKQRPEDLVYHFETSFKDFAKKYNKYLVTTQGAVKRILELPWQGNILQLKVFCERLVLAADKRSVDEVYIQKTYDSLYPRMKEQEGYKRVVVYQSPEADSIGDLMEQYHGNRAKVAKALGISTTTLWRRMKKYGIEAKYN